MNRIESLGVRTGVWAGALQWTKRCETLKVRTGVRVGARTWANRCEALKVPGRVRGAGQRSALEPSSPTR